MEPKRGPAREAADKMQVTARTPTQSVSIPGNSALFLYRQQHFVVPVVPVAQMLCTST